MRLGHVIGRPPDAPDVELEMTTTLGSVDVGDQPPKGFFRGVNQLESIAWQRRNTGHRRAEAAVLLALGAHGKPIGDGPGVELFEPIDIRRVDPRGANGALAPQAVLADEQIDRRAGKGDQQHQRQPGQRDANRPPPIDHAHRQADANGQVGEKDGDCD